MEEHRRKRRREKAKVMSDHTIYDGCQWREGSSESLSLVRL